jgi:hypothetical protein
VPSFNRTHFDDGLTLSFNALTVMVFADLKGIFLGTRPSKVEHAAKTGWSGLSEPALLVDDMSVRDSWARRLEASAQDQRGFYQDGISLYLSSLWNENEVKRGRGRRSFSIYFLRKCVPLLDCESSSLESATICFRNDQLDRRKQSVQAGRTILKTSSCRACHPVDVLNLDLVSLKSLRATQVMSGKQVEKTLLWITAATVVVGLSAWAERKLRAQTSRPEQVDKQETGSGKVVHGVIGLIGKCFNFTPD